LWLTSGPKRIIFADKENDPAKIEDEGKEDVGLDQERTASFARIKRKSTGRCERVVTSMG